MKRALNIRLPERLREEVQEAAEMDGGRSMNSWLVKAVQEKLIRDKNEKPQAAATAQG